MKEFPSIQIWNKEGPRGRKGRGRSREEAGIGLPGGNQGWMAEPVAGGGGCERRERSAASGGWRRRSREGAGLVAPGGNQGWMEEPVVGGGDCQTPRKGRGKRRRTRVPQREASPGAPDGDWVLKEEKVRPEEAPVAVRRCAVARGTGWHRSRCRRAARRPSSDGEDAPLFRTKRMV